MNKLSVIIANYNNGRFFEAAYRSLLGQSSPNWEAIVIDDASTDNSVEMISQLIAGDRRFRFYQNDVNMGYQRTVMRGIELSVNEIFGRLDPDDALYSEAVERSLAVHDQFPHVGLVYSDITVCDEALQVEYVHQSTQIDVLDEKYYLLEAEIGAFATFKKKIYHAAGGIDAAVKRAEDIDIYMKMCEEAPVKRIPQPLYYYRFHKGSVSKMDNADRSYFWHWVALVKMAERRNVNLEDTYASYIGSREQLNAYKRRTEYIKQKLSEHRILAHLANFFKQKLLV